VSRWSCWLAHAPRRRTERAPRPPVGHLVVAAPCAWCCAAAALVIFIFSLQLLFTCVSVCMFCLPAIQLVALLPLSWTHIALVSLVREFRQCTSVRRVAALFVSFLLNHFPIWKKERKTNTTKKWDVAGSFLSKGFWTFCYGDAVATWSDDNSAGRVDSSIVSVSTSHSIGDKRNEWRRPVDDQYDGHASN
jgi:hypothetical protein